MDELDKLEQALRKITSGQAIHQFAKQETPKLKNVIISAIQEWYSSYSPQVYQRTYNFMSVGDASEVRNAGNSIIIKISSNNMTDYKYDTADYVFEGITEYGYHIKEISLDLYDDEILENVATEYETKFHNLGYPIYRIVVKKD